MARYLYLMRHGSPGDPLQEKRCLGSTDVSLSSYGRRQIEKMKDSVKKLPWTKVYTSSMKRCLETAQCLGMEPDTLHIREDLREMAAGIWENKTFAQIKETDPEGYSARGKNLGSYAVEGAESFKEAGMRFGTCLDQIRKETKENLLVIAHAGVIRGYLCKLTGCSYDEVMKFPAAYGSITTLREEDGVLELIEAGIRPLSCLDEEEITWIYRKWNTPEHVIAHMKKVAQTAAQYSKEEILYQAALLHDVCRTEKNHAQKAAAFLRKEGYKEVAELIQGHHSDLENTGKEVTLEEILFYADKRVEEDRMVSLKERFSHSKKKCAGNPEAEEKHRRLYEKALRIEEKLYNKKKKEANSFMEFHVKS